MTCYYTQNQLNITFWDKGAIKQNISLKNKRLPGIVRQSRKTKRHRSVNEMPDWASEKPGNTRNTCRKYYIHPALIALCEEKKELPELTKNTKRDFNTSEQLLMHILESENDYPDEATNNLFEPHRHIET